ncbi:MAG TPA: efflux transporter outer membrane subunit, partial [Methylocystis sp.]|nr:efflux transporter outer membrane subunit [Methylocystis sp.]
APKSAPSFHSAHEFVERFRSQELTRIVDEALIGNNDIAAAVARITQADAQARISSAPLFPTVTNINSAQRTQVPGTSVFTTPNYNPAQQFLAAAGKPTTLVQNEGVFSATRTNLFKLGLNASYTIDIWGVNEDGSKAARLLANASRFDRNVVEIATVASVLNSYFAVLNAQDQLRIVHENAHIAREVLKALQARLEVGTATVLDTAQQETVLDTQLAMIPPLEQTVAQQRNLLAVLLGRTPESFSTQGTTLKSLRFPRIEPGLPSEVLLRRPDVAEAEAKLASQEFSVLQARAAFFPQIQLTGQYGVQSIVWKNLTTPQAIAWQVLANTTQPIFDGWNLQGQYDLQKGKFAELAADYRKQTLTALSDTENALIAIAETERQLKLQQDSVDAAKRALTAAQARLKEGTIDVVTLATTETAYFQNMLTLEQVRLALFQAATTFYQALGGGWSPTTREAEIARADEAFAADRGPWP